jgi:hypothetical protein
MPTPISRFWRSLESVVGLSAVRAEWGWLLGDELPLVQTAKLLRPTGALATAYPREPGSAFSLLPYRVVHHGEDDYVGVCPDGGESMRLTREQLVLWEVDLRRLAGQLAASISVSAAFEAEVLPFTSRVGAYAVGGTAVPIYLTAALERSQLTSAALGLAALHEPCVLLAPTRRRLAEECHSTFRARRMCFAALDELLLIVEGTGQFVTARPLGQLLAEQRCVVAQGGEVLPASRPDGCYGPRTVVYLGREHICDLTKAEMAFLDLALKEQDIDVHRMMHPKEGVVFKTRYVSDDEQKRNRISQFLSRLGKRLSKAKPPLRIHFSLPRGRDYVVRDDPADAPPPADTSLTRE